MKKTTLFEKAFKKSLKKKKPAEEDDSSVGGGALGSAAAVGHNDLTNTDWYAPGDYRVPKILGMYSRKGKVGKKKRKTRKSKNKK